MKIGIMQPYLFPYIGYWQLINAVDKFVIYDNIQFTKKSWIRKNRILVNGKDQLFSIPLKKGSDYLDIRDRYLSETIELDKKKLINLITTAYKKAPYFSEAYPVIEKCINYQNDNLFEYIYHSVKEICNYLGITTEIIISSTLNMDHSLRNKYRVIETCKILNGNTYINPIGGTSLYDKDEFLDQGIELKFIKTNDIKYKQFDNPFIASLSIIDVMMFVSKDAIKKLLTDYTFA